MRFSLRLVFASAIALIAVLTAGTSVGGATRHQTASVRVPNVTGLYLDVAERRIRAAHLIPVEKGGGIFGIVIKADWQVCIQTPQGGRHVARGSRVTVFVSRPGRC